MDRLSKGERVVAICAGLLVIFSVLPLWAKYTIEAFGASESESATIWDTDAFSLVPMLGILLAVVALVMVAIKAFGGDPSLPLSAGLIYVGLGALTTLFLLITLIAGPKDLAQQAGLDALQDFGDLEVGIELEQSRGILLFVGVALAAGIAYGGYLHMKQEENSDVAAGDRPAPPPPSAP